MSGENDQNALRNYRNSHKKKFRVLAVFRHPQRGLACEEVPWCETRVVAVKGNDHNVFRQHENTTMRRGRFLLQPQSDLRRVVANLKKGDSKWTVYKFSNLLIKNTCNVCLIKNNSKVY